MKHAKECMTSRANLAAYQHRYDREHRQRKAHAPGWIKALWKAEREVGNRVDVDKRERQEYDRVFNQLLAAFHRGLI